MSLLSESVPVNSSCGVAVVNVVSSAVSKTTDGGVPVNSFLNVATAPYISSLVPVYENVVSTVCVVVRTKLAIWAVGRPPEFPYITSLKEFVYALPLDMLPPLSTAK